MHHASRLAFPAPLPASHHRDLIATAYRHIQNELVCFLNHHVLQREERKQGLGWLKERETMMSVSPSMTTLSHLIIILSLGCPFQCCVMRQYFMCKAIPRMDRESGKIWAHRHRNLRSSSPTPKIDCWIMMCCCKKQPTSWGIEIIASRQANPVSAYPTARFRFDVVHQDDVL